jgi:ribonuclease HI
MPDFTCESCGASFALSETILGRYPGWTPRQCRACRDTGATGAAKGGIAPGAVRGGRKRPSIEENLTVAEVLAKYADGPADGVFTDGSCEPNPGPGGWGAVYVVRGEVVDQAHGQDPMTTNNRMELTALIQGVLLVPPGTPAVVYSDSRLVIDTLTKWAASWERAGWKRKTGPVQNLDLVQEAYALVSARPELRLEWIAAHAGSRWNEYADALSTAYRRDTV